MKFMETIETTVGQARIVGAMSDGRVVAAFTVVKTLDAENGKPALEKHYTPHRIFSHCERHQVWYLTECPQCAADREAGRGG